MSPRRPKSELVNELVSEFRISGNQDNAFDNLAAERLGVNRTDLHCLNIIENSGGLTAGELAAEAGLTTSGHRRRRSPGEGRLRAARARPCRPPAGEGRGDAEVLFTRGQDLRPMKADWDAASKVASPARSSSGSPSSSGRPMRSAAGTSIACAG